VMAARAIPKAYFDYWVGDAMLCTRFEPLACESIVESGLFDAAFKHARVAAAHKGIFDYSSATKYCRMMLEDNGGCTQSLPPAFKSAVIDRRHACGDVSLSGVGVVTNPRNPNEILSVMQPSYDHLESQKLAETATFLFFAVLIMYLFYASMVEEIRDLIKTADFLVSFPGTLHWTQDRGGQDLGKQSEENERYVIERIHPMHRAELVFVLVTRTMILVVVLTFGTWFLLTEDSTMELVLNAVALSFITSIDELMYQVFVESTTKKAIGFESAKRIEFHGYVPRDGGTSWFSFFGIAFRKDFWGLIVLPIIALCTVLNYAHYGRQPIIEAMTCSCVQQGEQCAESIDNQGVFWKEYWTRTLPAAIHQIEAMRLRGM